MFEIFQFWKFLNIYLQEDDRDQENKSSRRAVLQVGQMLGETALSVPRVLSPTGLQ